MHISKLLVAVASLATGALAQFGLTTSSGSYTVNTGGGLIFTVSRSNGDITSLNYRGTEYQATEKMTHINSGLGTSTVTAQTVGTDYIKITVVSAGNPVTHYYVAKNGDSSIYMATDITGEVNPGELRFLARLRKTNLPNGIRQPVADIAGGTAIEGSDVFTVNGQTRCKYFSSERFIDDQIHGVSGSGVYISFVIPGTAYETSSGGPFMRDINNQGTDTQQELTFYMNSGHIRTEPWRMGLKGPYALVFSNSGFPSGTRDTSFFSQLSIPNYVAQSGRGRVTGTVSGIPSNFQAVVAWSNNANQYWTYASGGSFTSPYMKPGTYTMKLYKRELLVKQQTVSVTSGSTTNSNIASSEANPAVFWRVGEFDGQPFEFKNGDKFLTMHPSDSRMSAWGGTYTVGSSSARDFPMAIFAKTGGVATIKFTLSSTINYSTVLRVGTTLSFKGGRPAPSINGAWTGSDPGAPVLIDSRGVTRGGYRGYGEQYTWTVPAGTLKAGANTLTLGVFGSGDAGYLSANYIVDAVELQDPQGSTGTQTSVPVPPVSTTASPTASPTTSPSSGGAGAAWSQCGGTGWTGPTTCVSGYTCQFSNEWYSQCVPV